MKPYIVAFPILILAHALVVSSLAADQVDFTRDVLPILSNHCFRCHGPDKNTREADLRLDQADAAQADLGGYQAIKPGDTSASMVYERIVSTDKDERMPPADSDDKLTSRQISIIKTWIEQGADYKPHWSFQPATEPQLPDVRDKKWARNAIDRFVLRRLEQDDLRPLPAAGPETLIRRVALDLTGLPPSLPEIDAFLADDSPQAYEKMVDHFLAKPSYGEQMARAWLDLARYADTNGYQYDTERQMWVWRDWVINAYNKNMPFDQFTVEQLAGDLLPEATQQQILATGFNRNHGITIEGGVIDEEYRTEYVMDRVVTTSTVWLGLTMGCARCHEHKFDPISQEEFYQIFAFFNQVPERGNNGFAPKVQIPSPLQGEQLKQFDERIASLHKELDKPEEDVSRAIARWEKQIAARPEGGWSVLRAETMTSSGGSKITRLDDESLLIGGANPRHDIYEITTETNATGLTAVRLETLTHPSLPGGGPGRHSNSNFVLSEIELTAVSLKDPKRTERIKFARATADYSQVGYEIAKAIDGQFAQSNGWAVDGPTRKKPCTAVFIAIKPFGFVGGTKLQFRLRHEANFATHGIGRPRLSVTSDKPDQILPGGIPAEIKKIVALPSLKRSPKQAARLKAYYLQRFPPQAIRIKTQIAAIEKQKSATFPATMVMQEMPTTRSTHVLIRGQYDQKGKQIVAGVPAIFPPLAKGVKADRLAFARWLVDPSHPLTARVTVNRYWQRLFGIGLVKTLEDFGVQGDLPSHPQLLDWLAAEFIRTGWDVKSMQKRILTSATYRQSSHALPEAYQRDPDNRLLARGPRLRLTAEEVRDQSLSVSGLLVSRLGGPSVYPYQPPGLWLELNNRPNYSKAYPQGKGDALYRRSLYTFWKRTVPSPMLQTFDAPDREFCTSQRSRTNTPLQALLTLHGAQFVEAARHFAARMMESGSSDAERITHGFRLATSRRPSKDELSTISKYYVQKLKYFRSNLPAAERMLQVGESPRNTGLDTAEHAAWMSVARLLLNLDETITKG